MNLSKRSLKLKVRTLFLQVLNKLPAKLGFKLYHEVQERLGDESIHHKFRTTLGSYKTFERITAKSGISIEGKVIIEIGAGWIPLIPYYLKYLGKAKLIKTFDLYQHFRPESIKELNKVFSEKFKKEIKPARDSKYYLPQDIIYYSQTNLVEEERIDADIVFSRFVLEHVTPQDLKLMHKKFKDSLKPGSFIVHFISPSDHRAYIDNSLSLQEFLKYSQEEWDKIQTKFDYHNRWRLPQYLKLFQDLQFELVHLECHIPDKKSKAYIRFKNVALHSDFKNYTEEELMAGSINVVLKV